ncbi:hypothetical protein HYZ41_00510 [archaeon]|nr:hypothetical protein [archaeon]
MKIRIVDDDEKEEDDGKKDVSEPESKKNAEKRLQVEKQMVKVGIFAAVIIAAAMAMLYLGYFKFMQNFDAKYGLYMIYTVISAAVIGMGAWHIKSYRHTFDCSLGMMAGMTIGMMAGFLLGAIIGATNGMFMGSVYGMITGMFIGAWCARCCGIMSIMEGLMAGLMGGIMGAMTTVMMLNDNLVIFMPILIGSIIVIMAGMSVMIYKESSEYRDGIKKKDKYEMFSYVSLIFVLAMLTMFVMLYGPKSVLLAAY